MITFKYYIKNINSTNTTLYNNILYNTINKLPDNICSSKKISCILKNDLHNKYNNKIFKNTFLEYFKYILLNDNSLNDNELIAR